MQFIEATFQPLVLVFTVSNLFLMGLLVKRLEVIAVLKKPKILLLIFLWGWVLGPAIGLLIAWALPLAEPFVIGLLLYSLAPCAPFLPVMVGKARGDMSFAGALVPLVAVGTVVFMPLMGPLLIKGLDDQHLGSRKNAPSDHSPAAGNRSSNPGVRGDCGNQDLAGGQRARQAHHGGDTHMGRRDLLAGDVRHGGQHCPPLHDHLHGRDGTDHV